MTDPVLPALAQLSERLGRCPDLDSLVGAALSGIADLFSYDYSLLLLRDEDGGRLYTIASHGYDTAGIGSEVRVGEGVIGMAAARVEAMRVGNLGQMLAYARYRPARRTRRADGGAGPGDPAPGSRRGRESSGGARGRARPARRRARHRESPASLRSPRTTKRC